MSIKENIGYIRNNVDMARVMSSYSNQVDVIAVTKYVGIEQAQILVENGITHLAENRTNLFLEKYEALKDYDLTWHLIGNLQTRKVKDVINLVDYFHALDSIKLAKEINKRAEHTIKCFLEVNVSGEESKHGFLVSDLDSIISEISAFDKIEIVGLMTMAPLGAPEDEVRNIFRQLKMLQVKIADKGISNVPCKELSMGMSQDYQLAIQEGATFVRIGREFFRGEL